MWHSALLSSPPSLCRIFQSFDNHRNNRLESNTSMASLKSPERIQKQSSGKKALFIWLLLKDKEGLYPSSHSTLPSQLSGGGEGNTLVFKKSTWGLKNYIQMLYPDPPICVLWVGGKYLMSPEELYDGCCQSRNNQRMGEGLAMNQTKRFQTHCPLGESEPGKIEATPPVQTACQYLQGVPRSNGGRSVHCLEPRTLSKSVEVQ